MDSDLKLQDNTFDIFDLKELHQRILTRHLDLRVGTISTKIQLGYSKIKCVWIQMGHNKLDGLFGAPEMEL